MPLLLDAVLLSNTVACHKSSEPIANTSAPANQSPNPVSKLFSPTSGKLKNQPAGVPAGTSFDTILQQDLSAGKTATTSVLLCESKEAIKLLKMP